MSSAPTTAGQISAFQTATRENVYLNTNSVCVQTEDHTPKHGLKASFSQTRVLPIVGKTSRAEIGIKSFDIQTKSLPIFQPQVVLQNTDIDALIYEVGLSTQIRKSMLLPEVDGTIMPTLDITEDGLAVASWLGGNKANAQLEWKFVPQKNIQSYPTITNDNSAAVTIVDTYGQRYRLGMYDDPAVNVDLRALTDAWNGQYNPAESTGGLRETCLTAVVIPSVKQKITSCGPFQTSAEYPTKMFIPVADTSGFAIGDPIKLFGITDVDNLNVIPKQSYGTVIDVIDYNLLQAPSVKSSPCLVVDYYTSLTIQSVNSNTTNIFWNISQINAFDDDGIDQYGLYIGQRIVVTGISQAYWNGYFTITNVAPTGVNNALVVTTTNPGGVSSIGGSFGGTMTIQSVFQGGYVINLRAKDGGHIEFLTNENTYQPFFATASNGLVFADGISAVPNQVPTGGGGQLLQILPSFYTWDSTRIPNTTLPYADWPEFGWLRTNVVPNGSLQTAPQLSQEKYIVTLECIANTNTSSADFNRYTIAFNGRYKFFTTAEFGGGQIYYYLLKIDRSIPNGTYNFVSDNISFKISLAPNFYTVDTTFDEFPDFDSRTVSKLKWLRTLGYKPTETLQTQPPSSPPAASIPSGTWTRAFSIDWSFSAYRNLVWKTQDLLCRPPRPPIQSQDFSTDYYNVYEINKFLIDCVNPAIQDCITGPPLSTTNFDTFSLNDQINLAMTAYMRLAFKDTYAADGVNSTIYSSSIAYKAFFPICESALYNARWFMTKRNLSIPAPPLPSAQTSDDNYLFLGVGFQYDISSSTDKPTNAYELYTTSLMFPDALGGTSPPAQWPNQVNGVQPMVNYVYGQQLPNNSTYARSRTPGTSFAIFSTSAVNNVPVGSVGGFPQTTNSLTKAFGTPFIKAGNENNAQMDPASQLAVMWSTDKLVTKAPVIDYDELRLLFDLTYDLYGFGTKRIDQSLSQAMQALYQYKRLSWGNNLGGDEWLTFESNSPFKFLFDNFPAYALPYPDSMPFLRSPFAPTLPSINFWIWDSTDDKTTPTDSTRFMTIYQSAESLSSCMSPVQSIVVLSENIPVFEQLTSPVQYLIDSDTQNYLRLDSVSSTAKIIGEIFLPYASPQSARTAIKYEDQDVQFYQLLDTKLFKQIEYSLYYRHRITQELVPLILTNYGSVNLKFIFRPIEQISV